MPFTPCQILTLTSAMHTAGVRMVLGRFVHLLTYSKSLSGKTIRITSEGLQFEVPQNDERALSTVVRIITDRWLHELPARVTTWQVMIVLWSLMQPNVTLLLLHQCTQVTLCTYVLACS